MTKQECAIIQAYTGWAMLQGEDLKYFYRYVESLLERPVFTHEIPDLLDKIHDLSKPDFEYLCKYAFDIADIGAELLEFLYDEEDEEEDDPVNHPGHYQSDDGIEVIDVIDAFTKDLVGMEAVCTGNILKYVCRWKSKNGIEDLEKARWYIDKLISELGGGAC